MIIDSKNLKELYLFCVKTIRKDERFYSYPENDNYALSTYGRLFKKIGVNKWREIKPFFHNGEDCFEIKDFNTGKNIYVSVSTMIKNTFFNTYNAFCMYPFSYNSFKNKWKVENLHLIESQEQLVEALTAKINHRSPNYRDELKHHCFIGRWNPTKNKSVPKALDMLYKNMRIRATNKKFKGRHKQYEHTEIDKEWFDNPALFKQYWLDNQSEYPGSLSVDKDILGYGETNCYAPGLVVGIPTYINDIFTKGTSKLGYCITRKKDKNGKTYYIIPGSAYSRKDDSSKIIRCETYRDALIAGRKKKAQYIRDVISDERRKGFIPERILNVMKKWADLCEIGKITVWEPSNRVFLQEANRM